MVLTTNGIDLHYDVIGEGKPLLWLHGFFGIGSDWRHIFRDPPDGFQIIAPDLRGHGQTTSPEGRFRFRECAQDVLALVDHLQIDRVDAIGLSGGGIALLHLATIAPARVTTMVIVSAPPYFPDQARTLQRQVSEATLSDAEREQMRARHRLGDAQIAALFAHVRGFADDRDDVRFSPADLQAITAETLIVFGDRDPLYPVSLATELYQAIPRAYLWIVPNGGHGPVFGSQAPPFVEAVKGLLGGEWRPAGIA